MGVQAISNYKNTPSQAIITKIEHLHGSVDRTFQHVPPIPIARFSLTSIDMQLYVCYSNLNRLSCPQKVVQDNTELL